MRNPSRHLSDSRAPHGAQLGRWTGNIVDVADLVYDVGSLVVVSWLVLLLLLPWASLLKRRWRALASHRRRHASLRPLNKPTTCTAPSLSQLLQVNTPRAPPRRCRSCCR
jgi:hypothetical protein